MMKVKKIFNNNLVSSINANGEEVIIYGKGIGFSKRANDTIHKDEIEKIYSVLNKGMNDKFKKLIADIPMQYINLADDIIKMFEKELDKNLSESILITLSDHLYSVVDRYTNNFLLPNTMIWEIKRLYPTEHEIALKAVEVINKELEINLSSDEAGFITFHIISAELNEEIPRIIDMTEFINDVLNIVKYHFQIVFDENTLTYSRFITHLQFLAQSIFALDKEDSRTNTLSETSLSEVILVTYPKSYKGVIKVDDYIYKKYHYHMTKAERSYLTIHIQRLLDES